MATAETKSKAPDAFAAFILTHGRPDRVETYRTLRRSGYTGPIYLVVDDEDPSLGAYQAKYGDEVLVFSKREVAKRTDAGDNLPDLHTVLFARNACWDLARGLGLRHFIQLDDDYSAFSFRAGPQAQYGTWNITCLDEVFGILIDYFESIPALSICFCQGGDFIGGVNNPYVRNVIFTRKAMNTFLCSVDRQFDFVGRLNDDVNTYVELGHKGHLFLTLMGVQIVQTKTQDNAGGMTEVYLRTGTYQKSFYTVLFAPSCVTVQDFGELHRRIHHRIEWRDAVPCIVREEHRKG